MTTTNQGALLRENKHGDRLYVGWLGEGRASTKRGRLCWYLDEEKEWVSQVESREWSLSGEGIPCAQALRRRRAWPVGEMNEGRMEVTCRQSEGREAWGEAGDRSWGTCRWWWRIWILFSGWWKSLEHFKQEQHGLISFGKDNPEFWNLLYLLFVAPPHKRFLLNSELFWLQMTKSRPN